MALRDQASLLALTEDVVETSTIEGEVLNVVSVRWSNAPRLGVAIGALAPVDRHVEGMVGSHSGAGGGTRTHTLLRAADFESAASTDSATPASGRRSIPELGAS